MSVMTLLRNALFTALVIVLTGTLAHAQSKREKRAGPKEYSIGSSCDTSAWKLVFHDEFNGDVLDRSKWSTYYPYSVDGSERCESCRVSSGNNTIYRDSMVSLGDGILTLGVQARTGTWYSQTKEHESGIIHSIGDAKFTFGRFEARCRIPAAPGLWPAFWGFGGGTEIDAFELCSERPRWLKASLHRWEPRKFSHTGKHKATDLSLDFHTYAVEWETDQVRWYLDGQLVHSRSRAVNRRGKPLPACDLAPGEYHTAPYFPRETDAVSVILNLAVSYPDDYCKGPREPLPWPTGTGLVVDYVRVYQRRPEAPRRDRCEQHRHLTAIDLTNAPAQRGGSRTYQLDGSDAEINWTHSNGLEVTERKGNSVTVRVGRKASGPQWLRAEVPSEPCSSGVLSPQVTISVSR